MRVLYFAQTRRLAGVSEETLTFAFPLSPEELWEHLVARHPALAPLRTVTRLARNGEFAGDDAVFSPGDEVALIPPVSGG